MNQDQLLEHLQSTAHRVLESIKDLQAGEGAALQRLQSQVLEMQADSTQIAAQLEYPLYLGG